MSLSTLLPTDAGRAEELTVPNDGATPTAAEAPPAHLKSPGYVGLVRRTFVRQLLWGLTAIAVLLVGTVVVAGAPPESGFGWLPALGLLVVSAGLILMGSLLARRSLRYLSEIEGQLHRLAVSPLISPEDIGPVSGATPFETGWNRLVDSIQVADQANSLNDRLKTAMLEYRHQRGERILNVLTDGIAVTDDEQRINFANNALSAILYSGRDGEDLLTESIEAALARKAGQDLSDDLLESKFRGRRVAAEITCAGDDSDCVLRVCRSPLGDQNSSTPSGFVWSIRDITQQKIADQMRDQFVNAATHELRTPMANIKAYAETLASGEVDDVEQQKTFCNVINDEVTRLARFIDDLLNLSRMEVGATALQLQVTEMKRFFEEIVEKVRPQMARKDIQFTVELPAKLPELNVDKDKLAVAMINLLGNAAKYTSKGGCARLHVALTEDSMQIDVEDTGIGIDTEDLPRVMEKFYRSSDPRVHGETGSGLGLSLTNEIIRLHGGRLSVSSELNKGSKFTFTLPAAAR